MTIYRSVLLVNILSLLFVGALVVYAKFFGASVGGLFLPPFTFPEPELALLTRTFQLLCAVPTIVCAFTFALLQRIEPRAKNNLFILVSAFVTGGFLINEIFRIHIYLLRFAGVPKLVTSLVYALVAVAYGVAFRRQIKTTPYFLLLTGMGLLAIGIMFDSLKLHGDGIPGLLEGVPKLFSEINIALYFWFVCFGEILRSRASLK
ncbi:MULTISPECIES: hypothetical protein [Aerosakkonema]|uniref:hypothetical protein n=1 Tax=Aerosakkonema TaxID=1246629 RepID=UPI0035B94375